MRRLVAVLTLLLLAPTASSVAQAASGEAGISETSAWSIRASYADAEPFEYSGTNSFTARVEAVAPADD